MINSNDLNCFLVTSKILHLTKAAKELGLSQPALSHCIKRLETDVGEELFLRRKDGLILTNAGQYLQNHGQRVVDELNSISHYLHTGKKEEIKSLSFGLHPSVGTYTLSHILKESPDFSLNLHFGLSKDVTTMVQDGKIDCAIAINPYPHSNLVISKLGEDEFQLWCHKKEHADVLFFDPQLHQSHFLLRQLEKKGIKFQRHIEVSNLELIAKLVYDGAGVGILPSRVIKNFYPKETVIYSKQIKPFLDRICFVYSSENKYNSHIKEFKNKLEPLFN
ncbi:MAG: LysR family transcriptional regulator [Bdellovibrionales bacterium]|nr:LysR family transcriptional regulator [Bdellovibrionales bacterium]